MESEKCINFNYIHIYRTEKKANKKNIIFSKYHLEKFIQKRLIEIKNINIDVIILYFYNY